jgi:SWI/SNF-related matrix-associated actin-dependent regulator 1 of chromatin subfamily A
VAMPKSIIWGEMKLIKHNDKILIEFDFNYKILEKVKSISGAKFYRKISKKLSTGKVKTKKNVWLAPITSENLKFLEELGFEIGKSIVKPKPKKKLPIVPIVKIKGLNANLYPYQQVGVGFIQQHHGRALLADDMGLGKTLQAIAWLQHNPHINPTLIICPSSVKVNWQREIEKFTGNSSISTLSGRTPYKVDSDYIIINYDIVSYWRKHLLSMGIQAMVLDEIHYLGNADSKRSKAVKGLSKKIDCVIGLSGTPIENKVDNLWHPVSLIDNTIFPSKWDFRKRYCGLRDVPYGCGKAWDGATNLGELNQILTENVMIRRLKTDVLKDLPSLTTSTMPIEIDNRKEYIKARDDFTAWLEEKGKDASKASILTQIEPLKQLAAVGKMKQSFDFIDNLIESTGKVVVMCTHKSIINELEKRYKKSCVKVDGSVTGAKRQKAIDDFMKMKDKKVFLGNIIASGVGVDGLQRVCSDMVFFEYPWNPSQYAQARDRINRIGQTSKVSVWNLVSKDTIEEDILTILASKQKIFDKLIDGKGSKGTDPLKLLLNKMKG